MVILIAEDSRPARNLIKSYVNEIDIGRDYDFIEVENGEALLQVLQNRRIDFIFIDWNLSTKMTGLDALKIIRKNIAFKMLPIIMVTSESGKPNVIESFKYGANDFIVKPIDKRIFMEKVSKVIKNFL